MLPNWLYGKSKSKLAELLGGGGGTPADYNQVKAQVNQNTEGIATLDDALDTKVALTQISNRNLLDNPWFTVNQRGITSWSDGSVGYSADRWKHDGNATGSIINSVYTCNVPTYQIWEDNRITPLLGKTLTLSWILSDDSIGFETKTLPSALTSEYVYPFTNEYVMVALKSGSASQVARITAGVAIKAVKLELGSVSTLAMDTAPNYTTELLKCQRYFVRIGNSSDYAGIGIGQARSATNCAVYVPVPAQMRAKPTLTIAGNITMRNGEGIALSTSGSVEAYPSNVMLLGLSTTGLTVGAVYDIFVNSASYLELSAEL